VLAAVRPDGLPLLLSAMPFPLLLCVMCSQFVTSKRALHR
jgi:hypothetical protein